MIKNFRVSNPSAFSFVLAGFLSMFAFIVMKTDFANTSPSDSSIYMRTAYIAATSLLMFDVLECAYIARGDKRNIRSVHFWIYAFYTGYFWALLMILMYWEGSGNFKRFFLTWGVAGVFFGGIMAWLGGSGHENLSNRYELNSPVTEKPFGTLYFVWPPIIILIISGFIIYPPIEGWSESYLLFQLVLLGSIFPLYMYKTGKFWNNFFPRAVGIAILLVALVIF